jgi:hypothetical protein
VQGISLARRTDLWLCWRAKLLHTARLRLLTGMEFILLDIIMTDVLATGHAPQARFTKSKVLEYTYYGPFREDSRLASMSSTEVCVVLAVYKKHAHALV